MVDQHQARVQHDWRRNMQLMLVAPFWGLMAFAGMSWGQPSQGTYRLPLEQIAIGQVPTGWSAAATNPAGPLAQWRVDVDRSAPSQKKILSIENIQDNSARVFNLFWTPQVTFLNGELKVKMRANSGSIDQGGGLIWRVLDANNYYVARYNPLENNFRLYYVKNGSRSLLASREDLRSATGVWVQLRIVHQGQRIQGWFNDALAWEVTDAQGLKAGGVGLWSKADAASSFADFSSRRTRAKSVERLADE